MNFFDQTLPDLGIAIGIPEDWSRGQVDHADVAYLADEQDGYRTSVILTGQRLEPPTPEQFEQILGEIPDALRRRHPDLEVVRELRFAQEGMPAWLLRYRWSDRSRDATFEQVMVLVVSDLEQGSVVHLDATTISPLAEEHLPVIQAIVSSIRPLSEASSPSD